MKIVCAIDGSRYSEWSLDWLRQFCSRDNSSVLLVHAVDMTQFKTLPKRDPRTRSALVKVLEFSLEGAARLLEGAEATAAKTWRNVQAKLLRGRPTICWPAILLVCLICAVAPPVDLFFTNGSFL